MSQLKRHFDQWRAGRKLGERIPAQLWARAVAAAVEHGAGRVAGELHLDYAVLKRRAALAGGKAATTQLEPRFVELFAPAGPMTAAGASQPQCVVELANARGAKMRVAAQWQWPGRPVCPVQCILGRVMIQITPHMRILVAVEPIDFRAGIDGLVGACTQAPAGRSLQRRAVRLWQPRAHGDQGPGL